MLTLRISSNCKTLFCKTQQDTKYFFDCFIHFHTSNCKTLFWEFETSLQSLHLVKSQGFFSLCTCKERICIYAVECRRMNFKESGSVL